MEGLVIIAYFVTYQKYSKHVLNPALISVITIKLKCLVGVLFAILYVKHVLEIHKIIVYLAIINSKIFFTFYYKLNYLYSRYLREDGSCKSSCID